MSKYKGDDKMTPSNLGYAGDDPIVDEDIK